MTEAPPPGPAPGTTQDDVAAWVEENLTYEHFRDWSDDDFAKALIAAFPALAAPSGPQAAAGEGERCPGCGSPENMHRFYPGEGDRYYCPPCDKEWWVPIPAGTFPENTGEGDSNEHVRGVHGEGAESGPSGELSRERPDQAGGHRGDGGEVRPSRQGRAVTPSPLGGESVAQRAATAPPAGVPADRARDEDDGRLT